MGNRNAGDCHPLVTSTMTEQRMQSRTALSALVAASFMSALAFTAADAAGVGAAGGAGMPSAGSVNSQNSGSAIARQLVDHRNRQRTEWNSGYDDGRWHRPQQQPQHCSRRAQYIDARAYRHKRLPERPAR